MSIPIILLFFLQRYLVGGLTVGGVKGYYPLEAATTQRPAVRGRALLYPHPNPASLRPALNGGLPSREWGQAPSPAGGEGGVRGESPMNVDLDRARQGTPIVDADTATFVWHGPRPPQLIGDWTGWEGGTPENLTQAAPGLWAYTLALPGDAYMSMPSGRTASACSTP